MYIELVCDGCGEIAPVSFDILFNLWKQDYDTLHEEHKKNATVVTEIKCHCGYENKYDGLFYKYIFQLIFEECLNSTDL